MSKVILQVSSADGTTKTSELNIVRFLDSGSDQGTFFFVMEYCDGGSLADVAKDRIPDAGKLLAAISLK